MIEIIDKHNCCGCLSCVERCPHQCISMKTDEEGFSYPVVDQQLCVHCDVCDSVCPVINQGEVILPIKIFASKNKVDELALMVDDTEPDKVVDLLMDADVDVTKGISICDGIEKTTRIKEEYVKDGEVVFTQEEETVEEYDEFKSSKFGLYSYPESLRKTLK